MTEAGGLNAGEENVGKASISASPQIFAISQNWGWRAEEEQRPVD